MNSFMIMKEFPEKHILRLRDQSGLDEKTESIISLVQEVRKMVWGQER